MSKIAVIGLVGKSAFMAVDEFHKGGETLKAKEIHYEFGGKGSNQAIAAARYGSCVSFLGAIGSEYKKEIHDFFVSDNVKPFIVQKDDSTAFATILTDKKGANHVTVYQGASLDVADVDVFADEIRSSDVLLINNEVPMQVNERAVQIAKSAEVFVIMNPAPSIPVSKYLKDNVDLLTPNEHETDEVEDVDNLLITLGKKGCYIKSKETYIDPLNIDKVVDTTGAGDTFNGVLAHCIANGCDLEQASKEATAAAGVSVTKKYAASSIPTCDEVKAFKKE